MGPSAGIENTLTAATAVLFAEFGSVAELLILPRLTNRPGRCAITVSDTGGVVYGGFSGFLGRGRMELLDPIGPDLWALPCPRALRDGAPPPRAAGSIGS